MRRTARLAGALLLVGLAGGVPAAAQGGVPDRPADFGWTIRALDGEEVELDRFRGEVLFIHLWASWCKPCVAELNGIQGLYDSLRGTPGVRFLLVAAERESAVRRFLRGRGYDLPFYLEAQRMPPAFGLRALPTTFIVDRSGSIVHVQRGAAAWDSDPVRIFLRGLAAPGAHGG